MEESNDQDELLSGMSVLLTMSITELLDIQQDVNNQLRIRLKQLEEMKCKSKSKETTKGKSKKWLLKSKQERGYVHNDFPIGEPIKIVKVVKKHKDDNSINDIQEELCDDTEDMILTQFEPNPSSRLIKTPRNSQHQEAGKDTNSNSTLLIPTGRSELPASQESDSFQIYDNRDSNGVYSSPLKGPNDSLPKEYDDIKKNLIQCNDNILHEVENSENYRKRSALTGRVETECKKPKRIDKSTHKHELIKTEEQELSNDWRNGHIEKNKKHTVSKSVKIYIFNTNPTTSKPWILEDFKPNKDVAAVRRGKKKVEEFYKKVGKPIDLEEDDDFINFGNNGNTLDSFKMEFDNLRNRTESPPGYGRLDFPTTQEREEDKLASKRILYQKTKHRFLTSVNNRIPPQEREFLFRRNEFNEAVDNGYFKWDRNALEIYPPV